MRAKNLKYLREKYREKQTQLSAKVSIAQNTLSNYEKGKLPIPDDVARKLAYHYRESVFDFTCSDISENDSLFPSDNGYLPQKQVVVKLLNSFFPFVASELDFDDKLFRKGFELVQSLQQRARNLQTIDWEELSECLLLFSRSWGENSNENAVANCLSIILWMCTGYYGLKNEEEQSFVESILNSKPLDYLEAQKVILRKIPNENSLNELAQERLEFVRLYEEIFNMCMQKLKSSLNADLRALADYYFAMMYIVGFIDNDFDFETNQRIGIDLITRLAQLENSHALNLLNQFHDYIGTSDI